MDTSRLATLAQIAAMLGKPALDSGVNGEVQDLADTAAQRVLKAIIEEFPADEVSG